MSIRDQPSRILTIGGAASWKTNLICDQPDIDKLYVNEPKYQLLINEREETGIKRLIDSKALAECFNDIKNVYSNIAGYNSENNLKHDCAWWYDLI